MHHSSSDIRRRRKQAFPMNNNGVFHSNFMLHFSNDSSTDNHKHSSISLAPVLPHGFQDGKRSSMMLFQNGVESNQINSREDDDLSDDGGEKKRRLSMEQVRTLERNFELGNRLEPERKIHLARDLGLQPRQVAIWFQNRRARWKTKQLEKDYNLLKSQFEAAKAENDALQAQNQKLHAQILALKKNWEKTEMINLNKETEGSSSENSKEIKVVISRNPVIESQVPSMPGLLFPRPEIHGSNGEQAVKEESGFCNIFPGVDEQGALWPWIEQSFS